MSVFISYSTDDKNLVKDIASSISHMVSIRYWDKDKEPGKEAWNQIFKWIDSADTVLVIITDKTVNRAMSVGQEVGRAKAKKKRIIPLVAPGIPSSELGFLSGITYIKFDPNNIKPAMSYLEKHLVPKEENTEIWNVLAVVLGLFLLTILITKE